MKKVLNYISIATLSALILGSCKKDESKIIANPGAAPTLTSSVGSTDTLKLIQANEANNAITLNWTEQDLGFESNPNVSYSLQLAKSTEDWSNALNVDLGSILTYSKTVLDFNKVILQMGISPNYYSGIKARIKASVAGSTFVNYSNVVTFTITPYRSIVKYFYPQALRVAGNFQGWSPSSAPFLASPKNNKEFEGYINFGSTSSPEFKLVKDTAWTGDYGSSGNGVLTNGGSNVTLNQGGVWYLYANETTMQWSAYHINKFGLIGSATANGWNSDITMTYNTTTGDYELKNVPLTVGKIKFRANNDWPHNLGDNGADGSLDFGGSDIDVAVAGNYDVTLGIGLAGNWYYLLVKK